MQAPRNTLDFKGQNMYIGFDVHLKSWKVTIMSDHLTHKTFSQDPKPELLMKYLKENPPINEQMLRMMMTSRQLYRRPV